MALTTEQVRVIAFSDIPTGRRKAQERLLRLYRKGKLCREKIGEEYCYFIDNLPGIPMHHIGVNWIRLWLRSRLKSWEHEHCFIYEPAFEKMRADGLAAIKNTVTGKFQFYMVENDRSTNPFQKARLYNDLYQSGSYSGQWWVGLTERFPAVIVATTSERKRKIILWEIEKNNSAGLEFQVYLLDDLKKEVVENAEAHCNSVACIAQN